jgi:hypothetical protein
MYKPVLLSLIIFLVFGARCDAGLDRYGFVALKQRPSQADLQCGNYSRVAWRVSESGVILKISKNPDSGLNDYLPFSYEKNPNRIGNRHVLKLSDGWLVGFDAGEFGGGLWWFSERGERDSWLKPSPKDPAHPKDIYRTENIQGFSRFGNHTLIFMGLNHLDGRSGRIFRLVNRSGQWTLKLFTALDTCPYAWVVDHNRLFVLTETGLWLIHPDGRISKSHSLDIGLLYPNSMIIGPEGALYIGMHRYVLKLERSRKTWREVWFVQSDCEKATIKGIECECIH